MRALQWLVVQCHSALRAVCSEQELVSPVISVLWKEGGGEAVRLTESAPADAVESAWSGFIVHCTAEPSQCYEGQRKQGARATRNATALRGTVPGMQHEEREKQPQNE